MSKVYYGLVEIHHAFDIAKKIEKVLGGGENAIRLMLETAMQETRLGQFEDKTNYSAGTGLCQADRFPFEDRQKRIRQKDLSAIKEAFDIDWYMVEWRELEHSPLLSLLDCRLTYKLRPEPIPDSVVGRAAYWKKHYNTIAGKGTEFEYIQNAKDLWKNYGCFL
jgi:hypothetical protein